MNKAEKIFNIIVTVIVVLTGGGFGILTGLVYSPERFWWVGMIAGAISAYPLAKLYLSKIDKASAEDRRKARVWFYGFLFAGFSGMVCSLITHGLMSIMKYFENGLLLDFIGFLPIVIFIGGFVGLAVGFILGAICTLVYVLVIKGGHRETASAD